MSGWQRSFLHVRTGRRSPTLRELYPECSQEERRLSAEYYQRCLAGQGLGDLTPFEGIRQGPGPLCLGMSRTPGTCAPDLHSLLTRALAESLPAIGDVDVAVSGGIDSWLLAAILRHAGYRVRGWYLESGIPGYCERQQVEWIARTLGIACRHIRVTASDFLASLPAFVSATESPIYNLHPVSKWLFARALRQEGVRAVVTGDGADQAMRQEWDCDLLPLTLGCFQSAGVRLVAPFLSAPVIGFCDRPFADKWPIRELAARLGVPAVPKHPTMFPAIALPPPHVPVVLPGRLVPPGDRACCLSYTTGLLLEALEGHKRCAGSPE